jgi:GNAT superfamily N-acetyltransferase
MTKIDKMGHPFEVRPYTPEDYPFLEEMYFLFEPKGRFQGMPPISTNVCSKWIRGLVMDGKNFLAWRERKVIGHVVILPDFQKSNAEYLIFVDKGNRSLGVGSELTCTAIEEAKNLGLKAVWLTVNAYNFKGVRLYKKFGFRVCDEYSSSSERVMKLEFPPKFA